MSLNNFKIECILTPGHTSGGMCFLINDSLFSGDTLFQVGIGRTDFPTGNMNDLKKRGVDVKTNALTIEEGVAEITERLQEKGIF